VAVDGVELHESYTMHVDPRIMPSEIGGRDNFGPLTVPAGELFMMGDNRDNSNDSRFWGTLPMDFVKGRAMFLYWSWDGERHWPRFARLFQVIH
jgi:signal peptidase I